MPEKLLILGTNIILLMLHLYHWVFFLNIDIKNFEKMRDVKLIWLSTKVETSITKLAIWLITAVEKFRIESKIKAKKPLYTLVIQAYLSTKLLPLDLFLEADHSSFPNCLWKANCLDLTVFTAPTRVACFDLLWCITGSNGTKHVI